LISEFPHGVSFLRKYHRMPKIPKIPEPKQKYQLAAFESGAQNFNPCKITQLCQNGGKCIAHQGAYYCQCSEEFYGKTCEFLANKSACENNLCQNGAICYSVKEKNQIIVNKDKSQINAENPNFKKSGIIQSVQYECWCRPGYTGSLCEYSEKLRSCQEDFCLHKGVGHLSNHSGVMKCDCLCDDNYAGERCQIALPCMDYECFNGGKCNNILIDTTEDGTGIYKAKCECLDRAVHGVAAVFRGEHCEIIEITSEMRAQFDDCFPCKLPIKDYLERCIDEYSQKFFYRKLREIMESCKEPICTNPKQFCLNGGVCEIQGKQADDSKETILFPTCRCSGLDEGLLCQKHVASPCDPTSFDPRGHGEKCGKHGSCVAKTVYDYICECETEDPCQYNLCSPGSLCVTLPIEKKESYELGYICICDMNQEPDFSGHDNETMKCSLADFGLCKNHQCKENGKCYPCDKTDEENLQLCNDEEKSRGFRCICPSGSLPPFCDKIADACYGNKCLNGAECVVDSRNQYSYICKCRLGFTGELCESETSPCVSIGLKTCVMGKCIQDNGFARGFRCDCIEGYDGLDCDLLDKANILDFYNRNFWWTYPLTMSALLTPTIMALTIIAENRARRDYELRLIEKNQREELEVGKNEDGENEARTTRINNLTELQTILHDFITHVSE
uniref:EGF-like domain-containing protein n=1 Tax=Dracunculus medinensis TaxID=318479 RepID=A0A0N4UEE9_DRAME